MWPLANGPVPKASLPLIRLELMSKFLFVFVATPEQQALNEGIACNKLNH